MIAKKTQKADLERKRFAFFQIGLILAGSICLAAFEFVTPKFTNVEKQNLDEQIVNSIPEVPLELMANTQPKTKKNPIITNEVKLVIELPPKQKPAKKAQLIDINLNDIPDIFGDDTSSKFEMPDFGDWDIVDKMPEFPGNLSAWIGKNIQLPKYGYPASGTVYVSFVVSKTGEVTKVKISKSLDPEYDQAAMAVVKKMPKWKPGEQFGKPVAVNYHLPIKILNR